MEFSSQFDEPLEEGNLRLRFFLQPQRPSWEIPLAVHAVRLRAPMPRPSFFSSAVSGGTSVSSPGISSFRTITVEFGFFDIAPHNTLSGLRPRRASNRARSRISPWASADGPRDSPRTSPQKFWRPPRPAAASSSLPATFAGRFWEARQTRARPAIGRNPEAKGGKRASWELPVSIRPSPGFLAGTVEVWPANPPAAHFELLRSQGREEQVLHERESRPSCPFPQIRVTCEE